MKNYETNPSNLAFIKEIITVKSTFSMKFFHKQNMVGVNCGYSYHQNIDIRNIDWIVFNTQKLYCMSMCRSINYFQQLYHLLRVVGAVSSIQRVESSRLKMKTQK